ncbi:MAG: alpha/beta hydrolase [Phycisphaerae bacterium]
MRKPAVVRYYRGMSPHPLHRHRRWAARLLAAVAYMPLVALAQDVKPAKPYVRPAAPADEAKLINVRFVVYAPTSADASEPIFCSMSTDGWPEGGRELRRIADGLFEGAWSFAAGAAVEYKFVRERAWRTVEKAASGEELDNRRLVVARDVDEQLVFHVVARWAHEDPRRKTTAAFAPPATQPAKSTGRSGDIREHLDCASPQLKNKRTVLVYLPPGYEKNTDERYPVFYMHDGQNIFDAATSFAGAEWAVDETAEQLIADGRIRKPIIVGIYNNADRMHEYTPWSDAQRGGGGRADAYLAFIIETLKPMIDRTYRTLPDREHTAIGGSSLGGLVSLYAAARHPDVFGAAAVVSPALWWNDRAILDVVKNAELHKSIRLWIDIGTDEAVAKTPLESFSRALQDSRDLTQILKGKGLVEGRDFRYEEVSGGVHHESSWANRIDRILLFLYGK